MIVVYIVYWQLTNKEGKKMERVGFNSVLFEITCEQSVCCALLEDITMNFKELSVPAPVSEL